MLVGVAIVSIAIAQGPFRHIDQPKFDDLCSAFRTTLEHSLDGKKIPGATAAVLLSDGRTCAAAAGTVGTPNDRKLTTKDPILAGSIGKTFVSALALQLVEEGKLGLDDKMSKWLGDRPWFTRLPNAAGITVRMLMNHSSGIPNHVETDAFFKASSKAPDRDVPFEYLLTFILDKKPLFPAGKGYTYSDTNYILLAMIEEAITGTTMYDEVARRFLMPQKLEQTSPSNRNLDPAVHGFYEGQPVVKNGRLMINPQWEWAGGGFYSTPTDLVRWAGALYGGKVLNKSSFDELIHSTAPGDGKNYGLGVEIAHRKWGDIYGHDGEWPGYLSLMRYYPKFGVAVATQINAAGTPEAEAYPDALADDIADLFIEEMVLDKVSDADKRTFEAPVMAWLHLIDAGKFAESWDGISAELKAKYTRSAWPDAMKPFLNRTGSFKDRQLKSIVRTDDRTITVDFMSRFSKLPVARETVSLKREADGQWRIGGYSIG
jgi:D-alanyl-D-alanine carboxypeptidase